MNAPLPAHLMPRARCRAVSAPAMIEALRVWRPLLDRARGARAARPRRVADRRAAARSGRLLREHEDVAAVVKLADRHAVPVIPFGVGSSLEGHLLAVQGGVRIDLSRMNKVLAVNAEDHRHGAGRRDAHAGQRRDPPHGPVLSRSTPAPTPRSAACARRGRAAPTPCATARCATDLKVATAESILLSAASAPSAVRHTAAEPRRARIM